MKNNNRQQNNDPYNNNQKKQTDPSKWFTQPCKKGASCQYRKTDAYGNVRIYCKYIHHPYDLCIDKDDCQLYQTGDCVWIHKKPQPKQQPQPQITEAQFPTLGSNNNPKPTVPANKPQTTNTPPVQQSQNLIVSCVNIKKPANPESQINGHQGTQSLAEKKPEQRRKQSQSEEEEMIQKESVDSFIPNKKSLLNNTREKMKQTQLNGQTKQFKNKNISHLNGPKRQMRSEEQSHTINQSNLPNQIALCKQIQRMTKYVLKYNLDKDQSDPEYYQSNIMLAQILKLNHDLRQVKKTQPKHQDQSQNNNPLLEDQELLNPYAYKSNNDMIPNQNTSISRTYQHVYQQKNSNQQQPKSSMQATQSLSKQNPKMENLNNQKNFLNNLVTQINYSQENITNQFRKNSQSRGIVIPQILSENSIDSRYPLLSQCLLRTFVQFLNEKDNLTFKFQVKNQLNIIQKYFDPDLKKTDASIKDHFLYSIQVLEQSCFDQLCNTITKYSYMLKRQYGNKSFKNISKTNGIYNAINKRKLCQQPRGAQKTIQRFFQHLFEYIQHYFQQMKNCFKSKTLQCLEIFYKPVRLSQNLIAANSPQNVTNQKEPLKGPIYAGGLRNICMRFFARLLQLFLKNDEYAIKKVNQFMQAKGLPIESEHIKNFMKEKREQISLKLLANQYEDNFSNNRRDRPMDYELIKQEANNKLNAEIMIRTSDHIEQIFIGQKDAFLTQESMKQYIELKTHENVYSDYSPATQVQIGTVQVIKRVAKCQILIKEQDKQKYNQKAKNRYQFLKSVFKPYQRGNNFITYTNEFIANQTIRIGQKSFVTIFSDGKYIIEEPVQDNIIQFYLNEIANKLKQRPNHPQNRYQIFYYAKANSGLDECELSQLASTQFFKHKVLAFSEDSEYLIYCNKKYGFYGTQSINTFKIHIHKQNGIIQFMNAQSQQQCQRYFEQIYKIMHNPNNKLSKDKIHLNDFFIKTKPYQMIPKHLSQVTDLQIQMFDIKSKEEKYRKFKRQNLSIITWNLKQQFSKDSTHRKIPWSQRFKNIINDLKMRKADIVCLQEVKDFKKQLQQELCEQNQLYFMPSYEDIGNNETMILTNFPVRTFSIQLGIRKIACCQFEIQTYVQPERKEDEKQQQMKNSIENVITRAKQGKKLENWTQLLSQSNRQNKSKQKPRNKSQTKHNKTTVQRIITFQKTKEQQKAAQIKNFKVLVMSIHLKSAQIDSQEKFLESIQKREDQLQALQQFFIMNEQNPDQKYDIVILAGDWNIGDEPIQYKKQGQVIHSCDHNQKYLKSPLYFDLQANLYPQILQNFKTYLHKGLKENRNYKTGGSRLDRILVRTHSSLKVEDIIRGLPELSLIGDYSVRKGQNATQTNFDKFTRSPSDHFGIYMQILFKI